MTSVLRALAILCALAVAAPAAADGFRLVVHPSNPVKTLTRTEASQLFLKKTTRWKDGKVVKPVALPAGARAHDAFCAEVHRKSAAAVKSYWNQLIFSGRDVPPVEKGTDAEVVAFVRATDAAIGLVSPGASTEGVRVVELAE